MGAIYSIQTDDKARVPAAEKEKMTELHVFVIDRSGSMNYGDYAKTVADDIVIPTVADNIAKSGGPITVSVHTFANEHVKVVEFESVADAETLRPKLPTTASGQTMYYDTLIEVLDGIPDDTYDLVSVQVFTDGCNNKYGGTIDGEEIMNRKIKTCRAKGWLFTFVGIDIAPEACTKSANEQECGTVTRTNGENDDYAATRTVTSTRIDTFRTQTV
jgi:hypothetical protein